MTKPHYTQEQRAEIVKNHIREFGIYDAHTFVECAKSSNHPAHKWFTWDDKEAAHKQRIEEARAFARIRIKREAVEVHDFTSPGPIKIEIAPLLVSPPSERSNGGGYVLADSEDGEKALKDEAKLMLSQWVCRFRGVLEPATLAVIKDVLDDL